MRSEKPYLFPLADALEIDLRITSTPGELLGQKSTRLELFGGYSPTVVSTVLASVVDTYESVSGVYMQIWGNLYIVLVYEEKCNTVKLFILDRSKLEKNSLPWYGNKWSRDVCYTHMAPGLKAVYSRHVSQQKWTEVVGEAAEIREACKSGG